MKSLYDEIGAGYNLSRKADGYLTKRLAALLDPQPGAHCLDIGCGTGNYTREMHKMGFHFTGIDPSAEMLGKARMLEPAIKWRAGFAEETGLPDDSIDRIMGSLTIHHWADLNAAFAEMYRILKNPGKMVIFTSTPQQMKGYWLNHYFPGMLRDSMAQMPALKSVEQAIMEAGFDVAFTEPYFVQPDLGDLFLYCGKHRPELYFNPAIRQGISSFSALANRNEVEKGLEMLRKDMDSGKINEVISSHENDGGDYLFITAVKKTE